MRQGVRSSTLSVDVDPFDPGALTAATQGQTAYYCPDPVVTPARKLKNTMRSAVIATMLPFEMISAPGRPERAYASAYVFVYDESDRDDGEDSGESLSVIHIRRPMLLFSGPIQLLPARRPFVPWEE